MEEEKIAQAMSADQRDNASDNGASSAGENLADASEPNAADETEKLRSELEKLRTENRELGDKALRLMAEMENLRRRTDRDKSEFSKYAISEFARDLLPVGDNIRRAIEAVPSDEAAQDSAMRSLVEGVEVTERELIKVFEKYHVKRFDPQGEPFNPHLHDAMTRIDVPNVAADTVVQVIHAGYMIGERVLRPAAVMVAKGGTGSDAPAEGTPEKKDKIPPGAMKVPEEVQAAEETAAEANTARNAAGDGRSASVQQDFQTERRRQSGAGSQAGEDRGSGQMRRQRAPGTTEQPPRTQGTAGKPSTLHKPVINSGKD